MAVAARPETNAGRTKLTLRIPADLHEAMQEAVRLGLAATQNSFVEDSIRMRTREIRHERMRKLAEEAMADPGFVADLQGTMTAFQYADSERWPPPPTPTPAPPPEGGKARRRRAR